MDALRLILAAAAGVLLSMLYERGGDLPRVVPQNLFGTSSGGIVPYRDCAAARAAGAAPLRRGEPGYAPWLDSDQDGVGCERVP